MAIHLPERTQTSTEALTPRQIVDRARPPRRRAAQGEARRRHRAPQPAAPPEAAEGAAEDVAPKNIIMIGPTGVGKTEIARRLAQAGAVAVPESRGVEVHRGRLRRARRRVDGARPGGAGHHHGARRAVRRAASAGDAGGRGPAARPPAAADAAPRRRSGRRGPAPTRPRPRASGFALNCARAGSISAPSRSTPATAACRPSKS